MILYPPPDHENHLIPIQGGKIDLPRVQTDYYKRRRQEAFCIIDKEPTISIKNLALRMGVNNGYAGNWLISYRRHIVPKDKGLCDYRKISSLK